MVEGLRYDRQTVGRPSSLAAQKLAKKKAGSWYDKPGEWLEAGIEAANMAARPGLNNRRTGTPVR